MPGRGRLRSGVRAVVGVSVEQLRAAVDGSRTAADGGGVTWCPAEWVRVWSRLTPVMQRVIFLRVLVGLPPGEVAEQLGLTRGGVDGAWRRALARIRAAAPVPS